MSGAVAEGQKLELGGFYTVIRFSLALFNNDTQDFIELLLHACLYFKHISKLPDLILS